MMKTRIAILTILSAVGLLLANIPQSRTSNSKADPYQNQRERMVARQIDVA